MTNYPDQIDNATSLPLVVDNLTPVKASVVNNLRDAILAIEKELGTDPSSIYGTVRSRLDTVETKVGNLQIIELAGDLGNTLEVPKVIGIWGRPISSAAPVINNVLLWDGIAWVPSAVPTGGGGGAASGDLFGVYPGPMKVTGIQGYSVLAETLTSSQDGYVLTWVNGASQYQLKPTAVGFSAAGDLSGTATSQRVIGLEGKTLDPSLALLSSVDDGYVLTWINSASQWEAKPSTSGISQIDYVGYVPFTTGNTTFTNAATFIIDTSTIPSGSARQIVLRIFAETTAPLFTAQLYNFTTSSVVLGSTLTTTSTSAVELSTGDLTSNLSPGKAFYQLQIKMAAGSAGDQISLDFARIEVTYV